MKYRYERKYLVPNHQLPALRARIMPFVRPDFYASQHKDFPEYTVRSIYLDSPHLESLMDKNEGYKVRKKLRIRGYDQPHSGSQVFLEIKRKEGNRIAKNRALLPFSNLEQCLEEGADPPVDSLILDSKNQDDLIRFLYHKNRKLQQPVNLIVYDREPYHGKFDPGVRITFDKNIRSMFKPHYDQLYSDSNLTLVWPEHFILEIKYFEAPMPTWAKSLVHDFKLQSQALSKYAEGYYVHQFKNVL